MRKETCWGVLALSVCLFLVPGIVWAEEEAKKDEGVTKYGVTHNIAEDRQVIRVGGTYEPEGIDKYMKRKFDELFSKISALDGKINQIDQEIKELQSVSIKAAGKMTHDQPPSK